MVNLNFRINFNWLWNKHILNGITLYLEFENFDI